MVPKINKKINQNLKELVNPLKIILKLNLKRPEVIPAKRNPSPKRLEKKVSRPAFKAFLLL